MKRLIGWFVFGLCIVGVWVWAVLAWRGAIAEPVEAPRQEIPNSWRVIEENVRLTDGERVATRVDQYRSRGATLPHTLACNGLDEGSARRMSYGTQVLVCGPPLEETAAASP